MRLPSRANLLWLVGYFVTIVAAVWLLLAAQQRVLTDLSGPQAQAEWQAWKTEETERQANPNTPVRRRPPQAAEPPALVLMRDSFPAIVAMSLLALTMVYGFVVLTFRGSR